MIADKLILRKEKISERNNLSVKEREEKSARITEYLLSMEVFHTSDAVLLYKSDADEAKTDAIKTAAAEAGKKVFYPKVLSVKPTPEMEFYLFDDN